MENILIKYLNESKDLYRLEKATKGSAGIDLLASINNHLDIIQYMIYEQHANPFSETNNFETALEFALVHGNHQITEFFIKEFGGMRYNYTSRLLMQRKRRQDHLLASKWYYTLMFPQQESILFYMINDILF